MLKAQESVLPVNVKCCLVVLKTWTHKVVFSRTELDLLPQSSGHKPNMLIPQAEKLVALFMKRLLISFLFHNLKPSISEL